MTPLDRLLADPRVEQDVRDRASALRAGLDPVRLLAEIRREQQAFVDVGRRFRSGAIGLSRWRPPRSFRWRRSSQTSHGVAERRSAAYVASETKAKRSRRRPDPLAAVTDELRSWFDADPSRTARELLARLKTTHSGNSTGYPDAVLRTLQRRLKVWRAEMAHALVFGRDRTLSRKQACITMIQGLNKWRLASEKPIRLHGAWQRARHRQGVAWRCWSVWRGRSDGQP